MAVPVSEPITVMQKASRPRTAKKSTIIGVSVQDPTYDNGLGHPKLNSGSTKPITLGRYYVVTVKYRVVIKMYVSKKTL